MKLGSGFRIGLAAVALLAQLVLPVAHGLDVATEDRSIVSDGAATVTSPSNHSTASAHDPSHCPACLALHQVRSGIGRTPPAGAGPLPAGLISCGREPWLVLPRTPDLVTAPPRAPPICSLVFA